MSKASQIDGLLAAIAAMERAQGDLDRAVVVTGIGALLADDIRERLVRMRIEAQRVKVGTENSSKAQGSGDHRESIYVAVRYYGNTYLARTSPPAAPAHASCTSGAQQAAIRAARKATKLQVVTGAYDEGNGLWRVEFAVEENKEVSRV